MTNRDRTPLQALALVVGVTVVLSVALTFFHVPSAVLFGSLIGGMAHALTSPSVVALPGWAFRTGQGLVGITIGALEGDAADLPNERSGAGPSTYGVFASRFRVCHSFISDFADLRTLGWARVRAALPKRPRRAWPIASPIATGRLRNTLLSR